MHLGQPVLSVGRGLVHLDRLRVEGLAVHFVHPDEGGATVMDDLFRDDDNEDEDEDDPVEGNEHAKKSSGRAAPGSRQTPPFVRKSKRS